jgi:hypothetical protein
MEWRLISSLLMLAVLRWRRSSCNKDKLIANHRFLFFLITRRCPFKISRGKPIDSHGKSWSFFMGTFFLVVFLFTTYSKYSSIELDVKLSTHSDARRPMLTNIANKRLLCKSLHCVWLEKQKTIALKSLQATYRSKGKYISGLGGGAREWEWPMWCIICS